MEQITFGTDGWRAIIGQAYTVQNVARVSTAVATWLKQKKDNPTIVIGHDCRFGGPLFSETAIQIFCSHGIEVITATGFISTPMISLAVLQYKAEQGVVITASHNPPSYNGYKLKGPHGGPTPPAHIKEIEALIPDEVQLPTEKLNIYKEQGLLIYADLENLYENYLYTKFDFTELRQPSFRFAYDAMYGSGQRVMKRLFPEAVFLHADENPGFGGTAPEPLHKNLMELANTIQKNPELKFGLANDGDADRIALYDEDGHYIDSHHIILLLIHYLHQYKKLNGKVVIAASTSLRVNKLCELLKIPVTVTPIGFKYISEIMMNEDVLVGGEESGGISVKGHIPERDGIFDGLVLLEYMCRTGKTLKTLCEEIYSLVGRFHYHRDDLHLTEQEKQRAIEICSHGIEAFGNYQVEETQLIDGFKFLLPEACWTMVRASGTEPLLRIYAEGNSPEQCHDIIREVKTKLELA